MIPSKSKKATVQSNHNNSVRLRNLERQDKHDVLRNALVNIYISGQGIEVGALHKPLYIPNDIAKVYYVDRLSTKKLKKHYPEVKEPMVQVDIIDDGEKLEKLKTGSMNFIIACHFYEHTANPIETLENMLRVVQKNGVIFLAVPDKRYTFDKARKLTKFAHIVSDYEDGPDKSRVGHYEEWVRYVYKISEKEKSEATLKKLLKNKYSIHYHVWDYESFTDYLFRVQKYLNNIFEVELIARNISEILIILRKTG